MTVIFLITIIVIVPGIELARFLADEAVSLLQAVRLLLDEDGKQQWLAQPWVRHLIGWWDMATFRLVDFKIDWKNLLIQGAQSSSAQVIAVKNGVKIKNAPYRMSRRSAKKKAVTSQVRFTEWLPSPIRQLYVEELSVARRHKPRCPCGESLSASIAAMDYCR